VTPARSLGSYALIGAALSVVAIVLGSAPVLAAPKASHIARDGGQSSITPPCAESVCTAAGADGKMAVAATVARSADACAGFEVDDSAVVLAVESNDSGAVVAQASDTDTDCISTLQVDFDPYTVPNGSYVAVLSGDGAGETSTFTLALPARTPATPVATVAPAQHAVEVRWKANTEPGVSYAVADETGAAATYVAGGGPAQDPSDSTEEVAFVVATPGIHTYDIEAARAGSTVLVVSQPSAPVTVTPAGPATTLPGGGGGGGAGGSRGGGQLSARSASASAFAGFAAPSQAAASPGLPTGPTQSVSAGGEGSGEPTLGSTYASASPSATPTEHAAVSQSAASTSSDNKGLVDSLAAALVVILIAGHLGAVARRRRESD
jgi:hypothetical protein